MPGDYSWRRFDKNKNYAPAGLLTQQGRVQLDSDWNEFMDALDRRFRAQTLDIMGQCVVPNDPTKNNIDGFKIGITADGKSLTIGRGRIYVDGILAENHGANPQEFDSVLSELRGKSPVDYRQQPFYPNPPALPPMSANQAKPFLVYLDVWQREVTYLEDPCLIERAVAVDTTARMQTVWQVKTCAGAQCKDFQTFLNNNPPSAGRLTTAGVQMDGQNDLCIIPPTGGYSGLENHLYRVEIHEGGTPGTAMFKWSRDNASFGTSIISISGSTLTASQLGRDSVVRFKYGDWIEIIDDIRELKGVPGQIVQIKNHPDESDFAILVDQAIGGDGNGAFGATDAEVAKYHTRIRKWDQNGIVLTADGTQYSDVNSAQNHGLIMVPDGGIQIILENGVAVTFSLDGGIGSFNAGDYWVFAARTAGAWVEPLTQAPPRGIHHHYGCLGVVTSATAAVSDCRLHWPPDGGSECCDCTYCVTPDSHADDTGTLTIGMAVQQAITNGSGGTICIAAGTYKLNGAIQIKQGSSIRLRGQGWNTVLAPVAGVTSAIWVEDSADVTIENLAIVSPPSSSNIDGVPSVTLQNFGPSRGVAISNSMFVTVRKCAFSLVSTTQTVEDSFAENIWSVAIALIGVLMEVKIHDNFVVGQSGIGKAVSPPAQTGSTTEGTQETALVSSGLFIENNLFWCADVGIDFKVGAYFSGATRLSGNTIYGCIQAGITVTGTVSSAALTDAGSAASVPAGDETLDAFESTTADSRPTASLAILENVLSVWGDGIVVGANEARIEANTIGRFGTQLIETWKIKRGKNAGHGIILKAGGSGGASPLNRCQVIGNRITNVVQDGISVHTPLVSAMFNQNIVDGVGGGGIVMVPLDPSSTALAAGEISVGHNQFLNMHPKAADDNGSGFIMMLTALATVTVESNILTWDTNGTSPSNSRVGIACFGCDVVRISNNQVTDTSPTGATKYGIWMTTPFRRLAVAGNTILLSFGTKNDGLGTTCGILVGDQQSNRPFTFEEKILSAKKKQPLDYKKPIPETFANIEGNHVEVGNFAVQVFGVTVCLLANNRFVATMERAAEATVAIYSTAMIVNGNFVQAHGRVAMDLNPDNPSTPSLTVLGNIVSGDILVSDTSIPAMPTSMNIAI